MEAQSSRTEYIEGAIDCVGWLKHKALDAGVKQEELCEAVGLHSSTVSRYFNLPTQYAKGVRGSRLLVPKEEHLVKMMEFLSTRLDRDIRQEGLSILHRIEARGAYAEPAPQDDLARLAAEAVTLARRLGDLPVELRDPIIKLFRVVLGSGDGEVTNAVTNW